jgi:Ca-activated chloride channel family protein
MPNNQHPLEVILAPAKAALVDTDRDYLQVLARLRAPQDPSIPKTPLSVSIVIDRSGSMRGDKLSAAKECTLEFIERMSDSDEVSIVAYDTEVDVLLPLTVVSEVRPQLTRILASFDSGGSTDLHSGWLKGAELLAPRTRENRMCRVVLLSDGQTNHGETNVNTICKQVSQLAQSGVSTSTVGIGMGFNEELMTAIAIAGQGTALYGDRAEDLSEPFEAEIGLLSSLAWRDVTLTIESHTHRWIMHNDYAKINAHSWRMPSIAAGSEAWMALSVAMDGALRAQQRSSSGKALKVIVEAKGVDGRIQVFEANLPTLELVTKAVYQGMDGAPLVMRRFGEIEAADIQRAAREAVRRRDWTRVEDMLHEIEAKAHDNPWLMSTLGVLRDLLAKRDHHKMEKELMYASYSMKSRLSELDEGNYRTQGEELEKMAFLRRKSDQGRRSNP